VREVLFGTDRVVVRDDGLSIYAPTMDGWRISKHRPAVILFEGERYQLVSMEPVGPRVVHYRLTRFDNKTIASEEILYDEEFVRIRDETTRAVRGRTRVAYALVPLYPILGFVWSDARRAFRLRYGFGRRAAALSFALEFGAVLLIATWVLTLFLPVGFWLVAIILVIDVGMRWSSSLRDDGNEPYGFFEWMFRRR
jgi:hypothetical protein